MESTVINRRTVKPIAIGIISIMLFIISCIFHFFIMIYLAQFSIMLPIIGFILGIIGMKYSINYYREHNSKINLVGLMINILAITVHTVLFIVAIQIIRASIW